MLAVGAVAAVLALRGHEGNPQFAAAQQGGSAVSATGIEELLLTTHDPRPRRAGRAVRASCAAGSSGALGNPWTCFVRYPRPPRIRFRVTVNADRSIDGAGLPEGARTGTELTVSGCCVRAQ
jgi:hypothetical protein